MWLVIRAVEEHMDTSAFHAGRKMGGAGTAGSRANLLHVTHTIAAEHRARRRLPRGSHPTELAGRSFPTSLSPARRPASRQTPARNPAPLSLDRHFYSNEYVKNCGATIGLH